jgi:hypothetical protein
MMIVIYSHHIFIVQATGKLSLFTLSVVDEMFGRRNVWSMKYLVDEMFGRQNAWSTKCLVDEMTRRQKFMSEKNGRF